MDKGVSTIYEPPSSPYRPLAMRLIFRLAKKLFLQTRSEQDW